MKSHRDLKCAMGKSSHVRHSAGNDQHYNVAPAVVSAALRSMPQIPVILTGMSTDLSQEFPQVGAILEAIEPLLPAYRHGLLSYVAVMHEGEAVILRAGVRFSMEDALPRHIS